MYAQCTGSFEYRSLPGRYYYSSVQDSARVANYAVCVSPEIAPTTTCFDERMNHRLCPYAYLVFNDYKPLPRESVNYSTPGQANQQEFIAAPRAGGSDFVTFSHLFSKLFSRNSPVHCVC
jgi:hypothetical protein